MSTEPPTKHPIEESLERAAAGKRDPEKMREAIDELSRSREETRKTIGTVDVINIGNVNREKCPAFPQGIPPVEGTGCVAALC